MRTALVAILLLALVAPMVLASPALPVQAAEDWDISGGHFFTQTGGGGGKGFAVTDEAGVRFWSEFQRLGGVQAVGYPVSQRFDWDGFPCQAMQRVVFQWRADIGQVYFVNVFDLMSSAGKDDWLLAARQTPKPLGTDFDAGLPWDQKVAKRLALLDANPSIKAKYYEVVGDPVQMNGLPTSAVTDMGNNYTLRAQRVVIQQWKEDVPWAAKGQVTVGLGGSIAGEAGILPNPLALYSTPPPQSPSMGALPTPIPPHSGIGAIMVTPTPTQMIASLPGLSPMVPLVSPKKMTFVSNRDGNDEIYTMNTDGTSVIRLTKHPASDFSPAWSPDGKKIIFVSNRDGNNEIYIMNADGSGVVRLTNNPASDFGPKISPDGTKVVFVSNRSGDSQLWMMNIDGTMPSRLIQSPNDRTFPSWSPDGLNIVFTSKVSGYQKIHVLTVDWGGQRQLTTGPSWESYPAWSPDGATIAYSSNQSGVNDIWMTKADGSGNPARLTDFKAPTNMGGWSPDGSKIVFWSLKSGNEEIYIMNADGSGVTQLTNQTAVDSQPAWQP